MPLTEPDPEWRKLLCACGDRFSSYPSYYVHAAEKCPLLRCCYCLEWLVDADAEKTHLCRTIEIYARKRELEKMIERLGEKVHELTTH